MNAIHLGSLDLLLNSNVATSFLGKGEGFYCEPNRSEVLLLSQEVESMSSIASRTQDRAYFDLRLTSCCSFY
eukprot:snap_masked-scaffold_60-processed-gene-0.36-mRNA-1 protein AED:1.00 eAED:1.00 QI:0/0/0/0/1/1/2/0/71